MRRSRRGPGAAAAVGVAALALVVSAHAVVHPGVSAPGTYERYVLRVPGEREAPTVRVELDVPPEVRVVSFADVPGWRLETREDGEGKIVSAAWSGELPARRFVEFPFMAVNPREEARVMWRTTQTYADGEEVVWGGPEESETPASVTWVRDERPGPAGGLALPLSAAALAVGLLALALALAPRRRARA